MTAHLMIKFAAVSGFLAVAIGAFGAHALKTKLSSDMLAVYQTAVEYQFVHTLALLAVAVISLQMGKTQALTIAGVAFMVGIVLFSGSLYALSLSQIKMLGAITPIGGLAFLVGWASLLVAAFKG